MLIPLESDVPLQRWPIANWALIALTVIISGLPLVGAMDVLFFKQLLLHKENFAATQLVSYQFFHAGLVHLIGNMLFLFVFGNAVNARLGHVLYLLAYLAAGVVSGLVWLLVGRGDYLLGASGAIMGVLGLFLVYYPKNDVRVGWWILVRVGSFYMSAIFLMLIYFALDLLGALRGSDAVAYVGHLGGWATGFAIGCALVASGLVPSSADEINLLQLVGLRPRDDR